MSKGPEGCPSESAVCSGTAAPKLLCCSQGCHVGRSPFGLVYTCWVLVGATAMKCLVGGALAHHWLHALTAPPPPADTDSPGPESESPQNQVPAGWPGGQLSCGRNGLLCPLWISRPRPGTDLRQDWFMSCVI